jgi:hypothetical protein
MSGKYFFTSTNYANATAFAASILKNGTNTNQGSTIVVGTSTGVASHVISLLTGDTVEIRPNINTTSSGNTNLNTFSGFRVGN